MYFWYLFYNEDLRNTQNHTLGIFQGVKLSVFPWAVYLGKVLVASLLSQSDKDETVNDGWSIAAPVATPGR